MKKIIAIYLYAFRNEEHCNFLITFRDLIIKYSAARAIVDTFLDILNDLIKKEEQLINYMRKSDLTRLIAAADRRIDHAVVAMNQIIVAALHHFNQATLEAAQSLQNRFEAFGKITRKSYEEEILDINLLLTDLSSTQYADKVTLLGLSGWITELNEAKADFEYLFKQRNAEASLKPLGNIKDVRREADTLYHRMIDRIEAAATMDPAMPPVTYDAFIAELNTSIAYFNDHSHRHARKDISVSDKCVIEPVDVQLYTGKAITPLPAAHYREEGKPTVELVFARDFFVTYKNNVEVGTADLILHGKNAYKGQKRTTFNISRAI
ncbi:MAG: DUF6261 family protein [Tannerella sp.]|jgi:hypothetical protein|nr:DUF6261 family protein [Tannerella sp.]